MAHTYNISTTGLRFYGPYGRPDMAPMLFADAILNDKVFNHGNMSRDFTYVDGIIDNPAKSSQNFNSENPNPDISAPYRIYNSPVQLLDFIETLEKSIEIEAKKNFLPMQDVEDFNYKVSWWYKKFYGENRWKG